MNIRLGGRAVALRASLLLCLLALPAGADSAATYQGKPLSTWLEAMRHDLDSDYRRAAMDAVAHFGAAAIPGLSQMLYQSDDTELLRMATIALIRIGPAGRAVVAERLTKGPKGPLLHVIDGISQSGVWARAFVPSLRTLANSPEVSLIALRALSQVADAPDSLALEPLVELRWEGTGGSATLTPFDCFVKDRFSSVRATISPTAGAIIKQVGMPFKSAQSDDVYWTPARLVSDDGAGRKEYEATLPKINTLGLTTIAYAILVETTLGDMTSNYVLAAISPTEEGCLMVGARPAPTASPTRTIDVLLLKDRHKRKTR